MLKVAVERERGAPCGHDVLRVLGSHRFLFCELRAARRAVVLTIGAVCHFNEGVFENAIRFRSNVI